MSWDHQRLWEFFTTLEWYSIETTFFWNKHLRSDVPIICFNCFVEMGTSRTKNFGWVTTNRPLTMGICFEPPPPPESIKALLRENGSVNKHLLHTPLFLVRVEGGSQAPIFSQKQVTQCISDSFTKHQNDFPKHKSTTFFSEKRVVTVFIKLRSDRTAWQCQSGIEAQACSPQVGPNWRIQGSDFCSPFLGHAWMV